MVCAPQELNESIAALNAYLGHMCDVNWGMNMADGGGGGGGYAGGHYGTMGSGFYDIGHPTFTTSDVLGSLWNATPYNNNLYTYENVNGNWYNTYTTTITVTNANWLLASLEGGGISGINNISQQGINFIMSWEKYKECPTHLPADKAGILTVGYGHKILPGENFNAGLIRAQAYDLLLSDIQNKAVGPINQLVTAPLDQQEFDALTSYVFNVGQGQSLLNTNLIRDLNSFNYCGAGEQMDIIRSNGEVQPGLVQRRFDEQLMWNYGIYWNH